MVVPLALLFADVQQSNAGLLDLQDIAAVDVPQQRPLVQIAGLGIHVGADIQHQNLLRGIFGGEEGANGGAINAFEAAQAEDR